MENLQVCHETSIVVHLDQKQKNLLHHLMVEEKEEEFNYVFRMKTSPTTFARAKADTAKARAYC